MPEMILVAYTVGISIAAFVFSYSPAGVSKLVIEDRL
jgi:hypothetical protein